MNPNEQSDYENYGDFNLVINKGNSKTTFNRKDTKNKTNKNNKTKTKTDKTIYSSKHVRLQLSKYKKK
tara:strand:- start:65 stop:268 length:204 start_codon:yes stop_codon:yes gene_type:complete